MSGTAARISQGKAYHHFTFLAKPNMENLHYSLQSPLKLKIETAETKRIKGERLNDNEIMEMTEKSIFKAFSEDYENLNIKLDVFPDEKKFPGINKIIPILKVLNGYLTKHQKSLLNSTKNAQYTLTMELLKKV
uniref:BPL/LPL catalytic domain-containing protein n=1 Tax=Meloidogyne floridensis TaxID=298350 RepID=A0A915NE28_9BILA